MRTITKIEPTVPIIEPKKKVAAYARISAEKGRTLHSLSAQVSYYSELIQRHTEWKYIGVYADSGLTGTNKDRAEFQRLISDCDSGKIDLILVKSISRFARNTVDLLKTVRHLRDIGVEVRFEKENINSLSGEGELMLSILASFAQEESRSISENVKWGIRKRFQEGKENNAVTVYGYRWDGEKYVIEPEEAKIVRLIFDNFQNGMSAEQTERQLDEMGIKAFKGGHFGNTSIRNILVNERYAGDKLLQKQYVENHISHKSKNNHGELPKYFVKGTHEPIIDPEVFYAVQDEIKRRRQLGVFANPAIKTSCFTCRIKCGNCGMSYRRSGKRRQNNTNAIYYVWTCRSKEGSKKLSCGAKDVPEITLKKVCSETLGIPEFDPNVFREQVEKIVVNGIDELVFHFFDGRIVPVKWKSTAKKDCWTKERREEKSAFLRGNMRNFSTNRFGCFTGRIHCARCGQNYRRQTRKHAAGDTYHAWACGSSSKCASKSFYEEELKAIVTEALGIEAFDERMVKEKIQDIDVLSDTELVIHFSDGGVVSKSLSAKRHTPRQSEERKAHMSQKAKEYWRKRHANDSQ